MIDWFYLTYCDLHFEMPMKNPQAMLGIFLWVWIIRPQKTASAYICRCDLAPHRNIGFEVVRSARHVRPYR